MSDRAEVIRERLRELVRTVPFESFVITLENGDHMNVEHPENIAFDPGENGNSRSTYLAVMAGEATYWGHLDAVSGIVKRTDAEHPMS